MTTIAVLGDRDWDKALLHLATCIEQYRSVAHQPGVDVFPVLKFVIEPLINRYERGERSHDLYCEMLEIE
jgi:hypothetical protein